MKDLSRLLDLLNTPASKQQVHCNIVILLIVFCLPTEHLRVHENSLKHVCVFQIELEFGSVGF